MRIKGIIKLLKDRKEIISYYVGNNKLASCIGIFSIISFVGFFSAVSTVADKVNIINQMSTEIEKLTEDMEYYQRNSYDFQSKFLEYRAKATEYETKYNNLVKENEPVQVTIEEPVKDVANEAIENKIKGDDNINITTISEKPIPLGVR